jgi:ribosomal protein L40E
MKAADHLALRPGLELTPVHLDALLLSPVAFRKRARLAWRQAHFHPAASVEERRTLEAFLKCQGVSAEELREEPPSMKAGEQFCPICHAIYGPQAEICKDCGGTSLRTSLNPRFGSSP